MIHTSFSANKQISSCLSRLIRPKKSRKMHSKTVKFRIFQLHQAISVHKAQLLEAQYITMEQHILQIFKIHSQTTEQRYQLPVTKTCLQPILKGYYIPSLSGQSGSLQTSYKRCGQNNHLYTVQSKACTVLHSTLQDSNFFGCVWKSPGKKPLGI